MRKLVKLQCVIIHDFFREIAAFISRFLSFNKFSLSSIFGTPPSVAHPGKFSFSKVASRTLPKQPVWNFDATANRLCIGEKISTKWWLTQKSVFKTWLSSFQFQQISNRIWKSLHNEGAQLFYSTFLLPRQFYFFAHWENNVKMQRLCLKLGSTELNWAQMKSTSCWLCAVHGASSQTALPCFAQCTVTRTLSQADLFVSK